MSLSDEWSKWHLTENGWVQGTTQRDWGVVNEVDPPEGTVLTCRYREKIYTHNVMKGGDKFIEMSSADEEKLKNDPVIKRLIQKYGECPKSL